MLRPYVADLAPGGVRPPRPYQYQNCAERNEEQITCKDYQNRKESNQPKSAQRRSETIIRGRPSLCLDRGFRSSFGQVRCAGCHRSVLREILMAFDIVCGFSLARNFYHAYFSF